jgi:hypothetical protein
MLRTRPLFSVTFHELRKFYEYKGDPSIMFKCFCHRLTGRPCSIYLYLIIGSFQIRDDDLLHVKHGLHNPVCFLMILVTKHLA